MERAIKPIINKEITLKSFAGNKTGRTNRRYGNAAPRYVAYISGVGPLATIRCGQTDNLPGPYEEG